MAELAKEIYPVNIEDELKQSYLDYAMSVIVGRALPDVRDGLKPVHRRVLYAMRVLGNDWNKAYKKSARIVGDVIGKYHPHGDTAVYDALVRMAQDFSMRYPLIDGQGNFGSVDGDPPAAMRYTEIRMAKIAHHLLEDLDRDTVDFVPNYDETEVQPCVLPTVVPNLLVNGGSGIAVGMATNIPPHNLTEVINACLSLIDSPHATIEELMQHIPGPDFPTAGIINGRAGIIEGYKTGRGRVYIRGRVEVETEDKSSKQSIIITELPYQVNKARFIEKIAELVKDKKIEGISALRDESDKDGMRVVIELRRGEIADVIINNLYTQTQLQVVFGINMVALVDGQPRLLSLKEVLQSFIKHRRHVVSRRTNYELQKARGRAHILEGLSIALANIDPVIELIKAAKTPQIAKEGLIARVWPATQILDMVQRSGSDTCRPQDLAPIYGLLADGYHLSDEQAQAILDLRLHRLTGLEHDKIIAEFKEIIANIARYLDILSNDSILLQVIKAELVALRDEFGDKRKTEIIAAQNDLSLEDLIAEEKMVVTLSDGGYVKAQPISMYQAQRRGGRGKSTATIKEEDFITRLLVASTHDTLLCFSNLGKLYWLKTHQIPVASRTAKGKPIVNLLPLQENEQINAILPIKEFSEGKAVFMATANGTVKQVALIEFSRPRANGIIAIDLDATDKLIGAELTSQTSEVLLTSTDGKAVRFDCSRVRCMGRTARGVRGMRLGSGQAVISLIALHGDDNPEVSILTATTNGFGKRTVVEEFAKKGRGGQGVISIQTGDRNGDVIGAIKVCPNDDFMLISDQGTLVRTRVDEVSLVGRNTKGVTLINLNTSEKLVAIQQIDEITDEDIGDSNISSALSVEAVLMDAANTVFVDNADDGEEYNTEDDYTDTE